MFGYQVSANVPTNIIQGRQLEASSGFSFSSLETLVLGLKSSDWEVDEHMRTWNYASQPWERRFHASGFSENQ